MFVTVQYFVLVASHPDFKKQSKLWESRGVPFSALMGWCHTPCGILAFVDLLLVKDHNLLREHTPEFMQLVCFMACYVLFYLSLIHLNHLITSQWPYAIL